MPLEPLRILLLCSRADIQKRLKSVRVCADSIHRPGQHLNLTAVQADSISVVVCFQNVTVEGSRVELRQHVHFIYATVEAVGHRNVNQAIGAPDRHCWLGTPLCKRVQTRPDTPSQNHAHYCSRRGFVRSLRRRLGCNFSGDRFHVHLKALGFMRAPRAILVLAARDRHTEGRSASMPK